MEYAFTVTQCPHYVHIKIRGDNNPRTIMRYLKEVHETCVALNQTRVLIEENLAGSGLDVAEIYWQVSNGSQNVQPIRCIAYVDVNPEHDLSRMLFAETVAVNRGVNVRVFATVAEAEQWLAEFEKVRK